MKQATELKIKIKVKGEEGIAIGGSVVLFGKERTVVGFLHDSVAFAIINPKTVEESRILVYNVEELKEFAESGDLKGMEKVK